MHKYIIGTIYYNHGSCSSPQARAMPMWAKRVREACTEPPEAVVVLGIGDSCHPAIHEPFSGFCKVKWIPHKEMLSYERGMDMLLQEADMVGAELIFMSQYSIPQKVEFK